MSELLAWAAAIIPCLVVVSFYVRMDRYVEPKRALASAFSKRLAAHKVSDETVNQLATTVSGMRAQPIDIDICQYGICLDYWVNRKSLGEFVNQLEGDNTLGGIRVFPKGIINPDAFLVSVEHVLER